MATAWPGVMPRALNTPRSCTRSLVPSSTVLSTPSPATTAIISVSMAIKEVATAKNLPSPAVNTETSPPRAWPRDLAYASGLVPGRSPTTY